LVIILFAGSFILSVVLTWIVKKLALHSGFVSKPAGDRFSARIVPLGGGIVIFAVPTIVILAAVLVTKFLAVPGHLDWLGESVTIHTAGFMSHLGRLMTILLLILVLFLLGLWDDKKHLGPFCKLGVQFAVAIAAAFFADIRV
jgi:UDP-N-acetylmuramyl pentapeptide phosphotransferase/UDP-N-acetylglucosamine-1-phosphate transferase